MVPLEISVVSPVFNEEACIVELVRQLHQSLSTFTADYEIILVDDGSRDGSWPLLQRLAAENTRVRALRFSRNFGHHVAITAGLDHASGRWVVVMDSDLQDPPSAIARLYETARNGNDIVVALRMDKQHGWFKRTLSSLFHRTLSHLMGVRVDARAGVFRILSARVVAALRNSHESARYFPGLTYWVGFPTTTIEVQHGKRHAGETKYSLRKQLSLAANALLSFSDKPLKFVVALGASCAGLGIGYAFIIILRALAGGITVMGYASLMSAVLIVGGVSIATTGLVGLYVGRIFQQVKGRPLYILSESLGPLTVHAHSRLYPPTPTSE